MQQAVLLGLKQTGIAGLGWTKELRQWRARAMLMRQYQIAAPAPWPDLSDEALEREVLVGEGGEVRGAPLPPRPRPVLRAR